MEADPEFGKVVRQRLYRGRNSPNGVQGPAPVGNLGWEHQTSDAGDRKIVLQ